MGAPKGWTFLSSAGRDMHVEVHDDLLVFNQGDERTMLSRQGRHDLRKLMDDMDGPQVPEVDGTTPSEAIKAASKTIERAAIAMALGLLVWVAVWLRLSGVPTTTLLECISRVMLAVPITVGFGFVFGVLIALRAKQ